MILMQKAMRNNYVIASFGVWVLMTVNLLAQEYPIPVLDTEGRYGYKQGVEWVVRPQYEFAGFFSEDLAVVKKDGKCGYINQYGETIVPLRFDEAGRFSEGLAGVRLKGKVGFIDNKGNLKLPFRYDDYSVFSEGLAAVKQYGKWGYISYDGKVAVPFKYENARAFCDGLAMVKNGEGKQVYIDRKGREYETKEEFVYPFSDYAKIYVERKVEAWQKKGKYEKTADWQKRVTDATRESMVSELTREAEKMYISELGQKAILQQSIKGYDPDNEVFLVQDLRFGDMLVSVPVAEARTFETSFYSMNRDVVYFVDNDALAIAELKFTAPSGKSYMYSNSASLDYFVANVDYRFAPIEIDTTALMHMQKGYQNIKRSAVAVKSDVDVDIPSGWGVNNNTFAVIIANEAYRHEDNVAYARSDGESFRNYCMKTLAIPEEHIHFCSDATLNEIRMEVNWLRDVGNAFGDKAKVIVYYSGHGVPDEAGNETYLLPVDGLGKDVETGYKLSNLYKQLGELPVKSVSVFLDACFSGAKKDGEMLVAARGVVRSRQTSSVPLSGKVMVFSASKADETAMTYDKKGHGLFTYFLLQKLKQTKGNVTMKELVEYVTSSVTKESVVAVRKQQTPQFSCSPDMNLEWEKIRLFR